jgi:hypothetical protein
MKYATEMGSSAMIYILSFTKIGSGIQKLTVRDSQTHRQHGDLISLFLFFQNKESRLKNDPLSTVHHGRPNTAFLREGVHCANVDIK